MVPRRVTHAACYMRHCTVLRNVVFLPLTSLYHLSYYLILVHLRSTHLRCLLYLFQSILSLGNPSRFLGNALGLNNFRRNFTNHIFNCALLGLSSGQPKQSFINSLMRLALLGIEDSISDSLFDNSRICFTFGVFFQRFFSSLK
jgi:hypothetical protein